MIRQCYIKTLLGEKTWMTCENHKHPRLGCENCYNSTRICWTHLEEVRECANRTG